jgi:hypothetical protein
MIAALALLLQHTSPAEAKPYPMPLLAPCRLNQPAEMIASRRELPAALNAGLSRLFARDGGLSDAGEPFNPSDVITDTTPPQRRFLRAYHAGHHWIIWYEHGGLGYHLHAIGFRQSGDIFQAVPRERFVDDPCKASNVILSGSFSLPAAHY